MYKCQLIKQSQQFSKHSRFFFYELTVENLLLDMTLSSYTCFRDQKIKYDLEI